MLRLVRLLVRVVLGLLFRVEVKGRENIPDSGPLLLCSNHNGELDMFFIGMKIKRFVKWMAKEELFRNPLFGALLKWLGSFPVKRGKADLGAIRYALELLKKGEIVGIFPEGTRVKDRDRQAKKIKLKPGAALLVAKAQVPILPVAITGKPKLFGKIRVEFGKPFRIAADSDRKYKTEELSMMTKEIMRQVYALMEAK